MLLAVFCIIACVISSENKRYTNERVEFVRTRIYKHNNDKQNNKHNKHNKSNSKPNNKLIIMIIMTTTMMVMITIMIMMMI